MPKSAPAVNGEIVAVRDQAEGYYPDPAQLAALAPAATNDGTARKGDPTKGFDANGHTHGLAGTPANGILVLQHTAYAADATFNNGHTIIGAETTGGARNVFLPAAHLEYTAQVVIVVDEQQDAATNNITIHPNGADTIDGVNANVVINQNAGVWAFYTDGTSWYTLFKTPQAGSIAQAQLAPNALDGTVDASVGNIGPHGGHMQIYQINVADASGNSDCTFTYASHIIKAWVRKTTTSADSADTVKLTNVTAAADITETLAINIAANVNTDFTTFANNAIGAGHVVRATAVKSTHCDGTVYIMAIRQ